MPAYFSINIELNKTNTIIEDFSKSLLLFGLNFKSGYWGFENDSFAEIIKWNQEKLNNNFQLASNEHHSNDYKQMVFEFLDFTEVRLFIINNTNINTFHYILIIPEDDFIESTLIDNKNKISKKYEKMNVIKDLAKQIWINNKDVLAIQTGWECSDFPPKADMILKDGNPQCEPFCIIQNQNISNDYNYEIIGRNGVLIENNDNWNY